MNRDDTVNPYAHISPGKKFARKILTQLQRVLPQRAYIAMYDPAFALYRRWLRYSYGRKLAAARRRNDEAAVACMERVHRVLPYSLIGSSGLEHTYQRAMSLVNDGVPGVFVECGVAQGGCAALIAMAAAQDSSPRDCWYFDSFEGLPDPTAEDVESGKTGEHIRPLPKGSCLGTIEQVSELLFDEMQLDRDRIQLVKGWFQDTLPKTGPQMGAIALLRIDGDWFDSTKCCLDMLFDQVSPGGTIIIDDYWSCYGARKATDQFLEERQLQVELVPDGRGGMSFSKPSPAGSQAIERVA